MVKKILLLLMLMILMVAGVMVGLSIQDRKAKYTVTHRVLALPEFTANEVDFPHVYSRLASVPFMAGGILDIDNDGREELFLGGGVRQADGLFRLVQDRFVNIADSVGLVKLGGDATLGCAVLDVDGNGFSDLIVTRESGVWLYANDGGQFTGKKLKISLKKGTLPLSVAVADINRDGYFDVYLAGYKHRPYALLSSLVQENDSGGEDALLLNNGDDSFTDITVAAGIQSQKNSLHGLFVDIDNDKLEDLVIVHEMGQVHTWKNISNLRFKMMPNPTTTEYGFPMGVAVADYNNDGLVDLFFTNTGSTIPAFLAKRGLEEEQNFNPEWVLLQNRGDFQFENVAKKVKLSDYELGRGALFEDINFDGRVDLIVSENHPEWPPHEVFQLRLPGRLFLQNNNGEFDEIGVDQGVTNPSFGIAPLAADFNDDGILDLVHINLGGKTKVFLGKKVRNHFLKIKLPDTLQSIGATVTVRTLAGKSYSKPFVIGKGVGCDQSHVLIFGLGQDKAIDVAVSYLNGKFQRKSGELFNTTVIFTEE